MLEEEYGFIRTHIFWVRDQEPIGLATVPQAGRELRRLAKGLIKLAEEAGDRKSGAAALQRVPDRGGGRGDPAPGPVPPPPPAPAADHAGPCPPAISTAITPRPVRVDMSPAIKTGLSECAAWRRASMNRLDGGRGGEDQAT